MTQERDWATQLAAVIKLHGVSSRMKIKSEDEPSHWSQMLISPVRAWLEGGYGPVQLEEIEWIELDLIKTVFRGQRIPDARVDLSASVLAALGEFCASVEVSREIARVSPPST